MGGYSLFQIVIVLVFSMKYYLSHFLNERNRRNNNGKHTCRMAVILLFYTNSQLMMAI